MRTSQVKKGNDRRKKRGKTLKGRTDERGNRIPRDPPLDRRVPGWQSAVWQRSEGIYVIQHPHQR